MRWGLVATSLLLVAVLPAVSGQEPTTPSTEPWHREDPADDLYVRAAGTDSPGVPDTPLTKFLDIRKVEIDEPDGSTLVFRIRTEGGFHNLSADSATTIGDVSVSFQVPGTTHTARVRSSVRVVGEGSEVKAFPSLVSGCLVNPDYNQCWTYGFVPWRIVDKALEVEFPKSRLVSTGNNDRWGPKNLPERLTAGAELSKISALASAYNPVSYGPQAPVSVHDKAPNSGEWPTLRLRYPTSLPDLKVNVTGSGLLAGEENLVKLTMSNLAARKRIVNLTADMASADQPGWIVSLTPTVTLGSQSQTTLILRVTPPATQRAQTVGTVRILARVMTEGGDSASLSLPFYASPPLVAGNARYYLHSVPSSYEPPIDEVFGVWGGMSRLEQDPGFEDRVSLRMGATSSLAASKFEVWLQSTDSIPNAVRFTGEPVKAHFEITVPSPATVTAIFTLGSYYGGQAIAEGRKPSVSLGATPTVVEFDAVVPPSVKRMDESFGRLYMRLTLLAEDAASQGLQAGLLVPPKVLPRKSWIQLPIEREVPEFAAPKGPRVVLAAAEDVEDFVRPGRQRVFEFDLRNEEPTEQRPEVILENLTGPWAGEVLPSQRFRLGANESVRIGVAIRASEAAKEGDVGSLLLRVRGVDDQKTYFLQRLTVTATRGIEMENETFSLAPEDQRKLDVAAGGSSPLPGPVWLLLAALAIAWRRRDILTT